MCVCYLLLYNKRSGFKQPLFYLLITVHSQGSAGQFFYRSHFKSSCVCCQMVTGDRVSKVARLTCQESGRWLGAVTSLSTWLAWDSLPVRWALSANVPKPKPRCKHLRSFCLHATHVNVPSGQSKSSRKRTIPRCAHREKWLLRVTKATLHHDGTAARRRKNICQYNNQSPVHVFFFLISRLSL